MESKQVKKKFILFINDSVTHYIKEESDGIIR